MGYTDLLLCMCVVEFIYFEISDIFANQINESEFVSIPKKHLNKDIPNTINLYAYK